MVRHRRWSTVAAFGLLVVGLVFLTGAWGAKPRVRVLHPLAVAQTYGGAAVECWAPNNGICQKDFTNCGQVVCELVGFGYPSWKCPSNATEKQQNVSGWYDCMTSGSGKTSCEYLDTVSCVKVFNCTSRGTGGCSRGSDGKYYCLSGTTGDPISYDDPHEQYVGDWSDDCPPPPPPPPLPPPPPPPPPGEQ